jgi:hypothetical protein
MGAVTYNLTLVTQDRILQRHRIEKPRTFHLQALHHRTSRDIQFFNSILPTYHISASAFDDMPAFQFDTAFIFVFVMV